MTADFVVQALTKQVMLQGEALLSLTGRVSATQNALRDEEARLSKATEDLRAVQGQMDAATVELNANRPYMGPIPSWVGRPPHGGLSGAPSDMRGEV